MQVSIRGQLPERISTAVIGTVLECHDQGFRFLGGVALDVDGNDVQPHMEAGRLLWGVSSGFGHDVRVGIGDPVMSPSLPVFSVSDERVTTEDPEVEPAARHLRKMVSLGRDGKLAYLLEAGMDRDTAASLVALVAGWVGEAGLDRLGVLSKFAVEKELGPGHVLERWINSRRQFRLAALLDNPSVRDFDLSVAYAVSHAAELVLVSYWSEIADDGGAISLVEGDDLD